MKHSTRQQYLTQLQRKLGYSFHNLSLLNQALTHRSFHAQNYERLEFVGDGILNYVVAKMLFEAFPELPEGRLSVLRSQLVKEATLASIARELDLGSALLLGVGELKSGGHDRASILADALEAIFAAISLDSENRQHQVYGFQAAENVIRALFAQHIRNLDINTQAKDSKTSLQEWLQARKFALPKYRIDKQTGEGNHACFDVSCDLGEIGQIFYAQANSRRMAEQECAKQALLWLENKFN